MSNELWDAIDRNGRPLGFTLVRGQKLPPDVYHVVVVIYTFTLDGEILMTKRHPSKPWPLQWEITGGSALSGETPREAAARELYEETGVQVSADALHFVDQTMLGSDCAIWHSFAAFVEKDKQTVRLQEGETVDWRWMRYPDFKAFLASHECEDLMYQRFRLSEPILDQLFARHCKPITEPQSR